MKIINRNSNIEILRIVCIFGIVLMHLYADYYSFNCDGYAFYYGVLINSICNLNVTIFMLITGYFGVKNNVSKIIYLWLITLFYSLLSLGVNYSGGGGIKEIIKAFLPISTQKYWYINVYILILIFEKYINYVIELNKKKFLNLIILMSLIFVIVPSLVYFHMFENGKNFFNMLLVYYIGRYLKLYCNKKDEIKLIKIGLVAMAIATVLNFISSIMLGKVMGAFSRDCSLLTIFGSISIFLIIKNLKYKQSNIINNISMNVLQIYLCERIIRQIVVSKTLESSIIDNNVLLIINLLFITLIILMLCYLISILHNLLFGRFEKFLQNKFRNLITCLSERIDNKTVGN